MNIKKWLKNLFKKSPEMKIIINDDLTPLEGVKIICNGKPIIGFDEVKKPRINSRGEFVTKTITRTMIQFVKYKNEYQVLLIMHGHEFVLGAWILVSDSLPLMTIKESERQSIMKKFMDYNYDIEVKES